MTKKKSVVFGYYFQLLFVFFHKITLKILEETREHIMSSECYFAYSFLHMLFFHFIDEFCLSSVVFLYTIASEIYVNTRRQISAFKGDPATDYFEGMCEAALVSVSL